MRALPLHWRRALLPLAQAAAALALLAGQVAQAGQAAQGVQVAQAAPAAPVAQAGEKASRLRTSHSGDYAIRMVQQGEGVCRVEVTLHDQPHWSLARCVASVDDLFFISKDGERFWVLVTVPLKAKPMPAPRSKAKAKVKQRLYPAWTYAVVASLHDRNGEVLAQRRLNDFIRSPGGLGQVRELTRYFKWLAGVAAVPGKPPRLNEAGQVELDTVESKTFKLEFKE